MEIIKSLIQQPIIVYGYGQAFKILKQFVNINCNIVVDNDPLKWGLKEDICVIGINHLKKINLESYCILICPFDNQSIINELLTLGVSKSSIITLKDLLRDSSFQKLYNEHKSAIPSIPINPLENELNKFIRTERSRNVERPNPFDCKQIFGKWFTSSSSFFYRRIDLKYVLAANISTLLEYVFSLERDVVFSYFPEREDYAFYGDGPIFVPMLARIRPDHIFRMNSIIESISSDVTILAYKDMDLKNSLRPEKLFNFQFDLNRNEVQWTYTVIKEIESLFFFLSYEEKKWISYLTNYYIQLIDFYLDVLQIDCKITLSLFPYYQQENIISQISKLQGAVEVVYQHGNYTDKTSYKRFHSYLYGFAQLSDYYLTWNQRAKQDLVSIYDKAEQHIKVLGNPMQLQKKNNKKSLELKKFLVVCPGKVFNHLDKINRLLEDADFISNNFDMSYDIRFHPLNELNLEDRVMEKFERSVNVNNCDYEDYAFIIGMESTLLDELIDGGFYVLNKVEVKTSRHEYVTNEDLYKKIKFLLENPQKDIKINYSIEKIREKHSEFLIELLNDGN